MKYKQF